MTANRARNRDVTEAAHGRAALADSLAMVEAEIAKLTAELTPHQAKTENLWQEIAEAEAAAVELAESMGLKQGIADGEA